MPELPSHNFAQCKTISGGVSANNADENSSKLIKNCILNFAFVKEYLRITISTLELAVSAKIIALEERRNPLDIRSTMAYVPLLKTGLQRSLRSEDFW